MDELKIQRRGRVVRLRLLKLEQFGGVSRVSVLKCKTLEFARCICDTVSLAARAGCTADEAYSLAVEMYREEENICEYNQ